MREEKNILWYLPRAAAELIEKKVKHSNDTGRDFITEIHIRMSRPMSLTMSNGRNVVLPFRFSRNDINYAISRLTENSLHAHMDTIKKGYINIQGGYRVGVCGRAVCEISMGENENVISNIGEITSINIRIAHTILGCSDGIYEIVSEKNFKGGTLFYGLPGSGKTTLLRDIAIRASQGNAPLRVAIIDSRGEFQDEKEMTDCLIDIFSNYSKAIGIEIATRTMAPELIVCDEIGGYDEARSMLSAQNTGIPLLATAHASCLEELLQRPNIKLLYEHNIFSKYIGIRRDDSQTGGFSFDIRRI